MWGWGGGGVGERYVGIVKGGSRKKGGEEEAAELLGRENFSSAPPLDEALCLLLIQIRVLYVYYEDDCVYYSMPYCVHVSVGRESTSN